jgi:predicted kinase
MNNQGKLMVLVGISGSGKSTFAKRVYDSDPKKHLIVNRDKIRELLFGYTESTISDYYDHPDMFLREREVTKFEDILIKQGLQDKKTVIVDATHLRIKYLNRFQNFNVQVDYVPLDIDLKTCQERAQNRIRKVSPDIVAKQHKAFRNLYKYTDFTSYIPSTQIDGTFEYSKDKEDCVIFDIDGTLAKMDGRSPFDWSRVEDDALNMPVYNAYLAHKALGNKIVICTGRDGVCASETKSWLSAYEIFYDEFHIRAEGDCRKDYVIKEELWNDINSRYNIICIYDDRDQVVHHARSLGIAVFQVDYGNF